jgi:hypothetical protein
MQKRDEEGPHLAEVYRINMWLRCLPSPRLMARFFARQTIIPVAKLLPNAAIAASRLTARAAGLRERLRHAQSLPRISSSSRKPCAMPIMLRPMDISATIDA